MPLAHARAMVPALATVPADPDGEAADLARLAAWCVQRYSPFAAVDPPDGVWIDITGCAHLLDGEAALLADLHRRLARGGIAARAAIAGTPGAAWAMARFGTTAETPLRVVPMGEAAATLADLSPAGLRLDTETVESLRRLGLTRIGQLAALPRGALGLRHGQAVLRRLDQALGRATEAIAPLVPAGTPYRRIGFAEPVSRAEDLAEALARLAVGLCRDLEAGGLGARRCDLLVHRVDGTAQALRVGAARPSRDPAHLRRLFAERLGTVDPGFGVEAMALAASRTEALPARQLQTAFGTAEAATDLAVLVDRLANRLGADRVYRLAPVESDLPERAVRRIAPLAPAGGATWPRDLPRPGRLLQPPEPIAVTALLPDHPPARFEWRRRRHRVRRADGPERLYGEWWRTPDEVATVRDYFRIEDESGLRFWVYRDGAPGDAAGGGHWYLHGLS